MANEVSINFRLQATKASAYATTSPSKTTWSFDMTGTNTFQATQNLGTSLEAVVLGEVIAGSNNLGWLAVHNLDATNIVEIYRDNAGAHLIAQIPPGGFLCCYPNANTIYGKALVAACDVYVVGVQK